MAMFTINPETFSFILVGIFFLLITWYSIRLVTVKKEYLVTLINKPEILLNSFNYLFWGMVLAVIFLMIEFLASYLINPVFPLLVMILYVPIMMASTILIAMCFITLGRNLKKV